MGRPPQKASGGQLDPPLGKGKLEIGISPHQPVIQWHHYMMRLQRAGLGRGAREGVEACPRPCFG